MIAVEMEGLFDPSFQGKLLAALHIVDIPDALRGMQ